MADSTEAKDYLGKHIKDICGNEYRSESDNHCAHFVSHVKGIKVGFLCRGMTGKGTGGASIRVHEIFAKCPKVGKWDDRPTTALNCLAFVTDSRNVDLASKKMANVPRKHVGIFSGGMVYHYSNSQNKVVKQTPAQFNHHYSGENIEVYYGTFPV